MKSLLQRDGQTDMVTERVATLLKKKLEYDAECFRIALLSL